MKNYNRMTIKNGEVFKAKRHLSGTPTDMGGQKESWFVPTYAKTRFSGSYSECLAFIDREGAVYQEINSGT